jgi:hypothetical protein
MLDPIDESRWQMTEAEELERIEADVAELGRQLLARRDRALEILKGRVATVRGCRFIIRSAKPYFGGINTRLFFEGPQLKQNGSPHARACEAAPLGMIDNIGPASPLSSPESKP